MRLKSLRSLVAFNTMSIVKGTSSMARNLCRPSLRRLRRWRGALGLVAASLLLVACIPAWGKPLLRADPMRVLGEFNVEAVRLAVKDLIVTHGGKYHHGEQYLARLNKLAAARAAMLKSPGGEARRTQAAGELLRDLRRLRAEALLANPLLKGLDVLVVKRAVKRSGDFKQLALPSNHQCNSCLARGGYDNEIAVLSLDKPQGRLRTLYRPSDKGYVGEIDLDFAAKKLLFTQSDRTNWKVWEIGVGGREPKRPRQVSQMPDDVDSFDACYLPGGRIVFGSTASFQSVPCWHGRERVTNLYSMNADGTGARRLCFDQDHNFHPVALPSGQVLYHRWDYTGPSHIFLRELMVMNPDGTGQRAVYGTNTWFPNSLYFPRPVPGRKGVMVCILSGYHGVHRMGQLVLLDTTRGAKGAAPLVKRISGRGDPITPRIADVLVNKDWPKFLHPYPLSDKQFLVSCWKGGNRPWGIYLADVFDNLVLIREDAGYALLEPVPLVARAKPHRIPDRVDLTRTDGVVFLQNIYAGPGLAGVPKGTIKRLRVIAYNFGYLGLAGPDKIGYGGPWEAMRILGTVPLGADGQAVFRAPANTPLAVQALDAEGKAVQLMRSWFTLMPGETQSCIGCHEPASDTPPMRKASRSEPPVDITPWYGPARGFDFEREVQPVLTAYCIRCHDNRPDAKGRRKPDLRPEKDHPQYQGRTISGLGLKRMHPAMKAKTGGRVRYTPAYDALLPYIRRVSIEDDVSLLMPGEFHADTSELIQILAKGHHGVKLDAEARDRLVTWIDLNAPCHGTWGDVHPYPSNAAKRRADMRKLVGGPSDDPEAKSPVAHLKILPPKPAPLAKPKSVTVKGWPFDAAEARRKQTASGIASRVLDLGKGVKMTLVSIPAGQFVMGSINGDADETPAARVQIDRSFLMGACEVTHEQFRRFAPDFSAGYYGKLHNRADDQGMRLDAPTQPVVRVSWDQASAFCQWLSKRTGLRVTLPTEAQWEWACRAGTATPMNYGKLSTDFSRWANVADQSYAGKNVTGGVEHLDPAGRALADTRFSDGSSVTAPAGSYRPNAWGLFDMHGNAAEWTQTTYRRYPYKPDARPTALTNRKVVRGGSFFDRPDRCRSTLRTAYPKWQRVFNVGFRVVCEAK
jgi:formylglycine-generating enzyme required for sulfatase activity